MCDAANHGNGFALTLLAIAYIENQSNNQMVQSGFRLLNIAALDKNVIWAKCIRLFFKSGDQLPLPIIDHALVDSDAITQLQLYADDGDMWAQAILGYLLYEGKVTVQNVQKGSILLIKSAKSGCLCAKEIVDKYGIGYSFTETEQIYEKLKDHNNSRYWLK